MSKWSKALGQSLAAMLDDTETRDRVSRMSRLPQEPSRTGQTDTPKEQAKGAPQMDSPEGQPKRAAQKGSPKGQPKRAAQKGSPKGQPTESSSPKGQPKRAAQKGSPKGQPKRTAQKDSPEGQPSVRLRPFDPFSYPSSQAVLSYFETNGSHVSSYRGISRATGVCVGSVRKIVDRMIARGLLEKTPWREGRVCGLSFVSHVGSVPFLTARAGQKGTPTGHPKRTVQKIAYKEEEIDREKNLSISLEVIRLTWPHLAQVGFGADQVDQIVANLTALGKGTDRVVESLDHAEWELARDAMRDKDGQPVADPCSWVFQALARTGYYRRPKGYVSPEEQAAKDAEAEARAVTAAQQKAEQARFEAWRGALTPEQLAEVMRGCPGGNREAWQKKMWKEKPPSAGTDRG